jgi:hypothetical protein
MSRANIGRLNEDGLMRLGREGVTRGRTKRAEAARLTEGIMRRMNEKDFWVIVDGRKAGIKRQVWRVGGGPKTERKRQGDTKYTKLGAKCA